MIPLLGVGPGNGWGVELYYYPEPSLGNVDAIELENLLGLLGGMKFDPKIKLDIKMSWSEIQKVPAEAWRLDVRITKTSHDPKLIHYDVRLCNEAKHVNLALTNQANEPASEDLSRTVADLVKVLVK
jgi:hypothetical protein